jgi:putative selenate reductase FAD-binding subunit
MIVEYHRPSRIESALDLLARKSPPTYPLAGGTLLTRLKNEDFAVVDIQDLPLHAIAQQDGDICVGAGVTLQQMADSDALPEPIRRAAQQETSFNLRQVISAGGVVAAGSSDSLLLTVLLSIPARVILAGGKGDISLADLLADRRSLLKGKLITSIQLPVASRLAFEAIRRAPAAKPELMVAVSCCSHDVLRAAVGGVGSLPMLVEAADLKNSVCQALYTQTEYHQEMAGILVERCLKQIEK